MTETYNSINVSDETINEFLNSLSVDKVISTLVRKYGRDFSFSNQGSRSGTEAFTLIGHGVHKMVVARLIEDTIKMGWFPSFENYSASKFSNQWIKDQQDIISVSMVFETNYGEEVVFGKSEKTLFHITPDTHYEKIKKIGLTPKGKSKISAHPYRIYLMRDTDPYTLELFVDLMYQKDPNYHLINSYVILQINLSDLKDYKFYDDPNFLMGNGAVFTYKNIPPSKIKVLKVIDV